MLIKVSRRKKLAEALEIEHSVEIDIPIDPPAAIGWAEELLAMLVRSQAKLPTDAGIAQEKSLA